VPPGKCDRGQACLELGGDTIDPDQLLKDDEGYVFFRGRATPDRYVLRPQHQLSKDPLPQESNPT